MLNQLSQVKLTMDQKNKYHSARNFLPDIIPYMHTINLYPTPIASRILDRLK